LHRRYQHLNIPIEIVRTVVAIAETGSLSKAGERLGLSQPAVSSQIKRLQSLLGGSLFQKTANGTTTTELGRLAVQHARRILEANDQLLRLGGNSNTPQPLRLGLSCLFVQSYFKQLPPGPLNDVFIHVDYSAAISRGLTDGYIDVACIFENTSLEPEIKQMVVNEFEEPLTWVRSRTFVLSPGAPIPILNRPGDDSIIPTLTKRGLSFKVVFNSPDYQAKLAGVRAGMGLTAIPDAFVPPDLVKAKEYYLPELPPVKGLMCVRPGVDSEHLPTLVEHLSTLFFKTSSSQLTRRAG
jgi:DNA-binding transcriptional LysR family regulator